MECRIIILFELGLMVRISKEEEVKEMSEFKLGHLYFR